MLSRFLPFIIHEFHEMQVVELKGDYDDVQENEDKQVRSPVSGVPVVIFWESVA